VKVADGGPARVQQTQGRQAESRLPAHADGDTPDTHRTGEGDQTMGSWAAAQRSPTLPHSTPVSKPKPRQQTSQISGEVFGERRGEESKNSGM